MFFGVVNDGEEMCTGSPGLLTHQNGLYGGKNCFLKGQCAV